MGCKVFLLLLCDTCDERSRSMGVDLCCFAAAVSQQALNIPQVHAPLQQMGCKGVPEGMHGRVWIGSRFFYRVPENLLNAPAAVLPPFLPFEEPVSGPISAQVFFQQAGHFIGEHRITVFFSFTGFDEYRFAFHVYICFAHVYALSDPKTGKRLHPANYFAA